MTPTDQTQNRPLKEYPPQQIAEAYTRYEENLQDTITADQQAGIITPERAVVESKVASYVGRTVLKYGQTAQDGPHLFELLQAEAERLMGPAGSKQPDRLLADRVTRQRVARGLREVTRMGTSELFPPTIAAGEQTDTAERNRLIDSFIAAAGNSLSTHSGGPGGLQSHGPNRSGHVNTLNRLHKLAAELPAIKEAANAKDPLDIPVETFTLAPKQAIKTITRRVKEWTTSKFLRKPEQITVERELPVEVDVHDPVTGERMITVCYDYFDQYAGQKFADHPNMPTFQEFDVVRRGGRLSFGMTLPESAVKQLQVEVVKDPRFLRHMADRIYTQAPNGPLQQYGSETMQKHYFEGKASIGNPIRPPFGETDKLERWNVWMIDATNIRRDLSNLEASGKLDGQDPKYYQRFNDPENQAQVTRLPVPRQ